jgi:drug/metabolite transporter (DMT)-like permease
MNGLLLVSLIWAFSFSLMREFLVGIPYPAIVLIRVTLATLIFSVFFFRKIDIRLIPRLLALGAVMVGIMYLTLTASLKLLQAHQVALLTIFTPFYVALLEDIRERTLRPVWWLPAILSVAGAAVIQYRAPAQEMQVLTQSFWIFDTSLLSGILLIQLSNLSFAAGQVYFRHLKFRYSPKSELHWMPWIFTGAILLTIPFWFSNSMGWNQPWHESFWSRISTRQVLVLAFLGSISSGFCILIWNRYSARVTGPVLAVFNNIVTPLAVLVSLIIFKESTDLLRLTCGMILILIGLAWGIRVTRTRPASSQ